MGDFKNFNFKVDEVSANYKCILVKLLSLFNVIYGPLFYRFNTNLSNPQSFYGCPCSWLVRIKITMRYTSEENVLSNLGLPFRDTGIEQWKVK